MRFLARLRRNLRKRLLFAGMAVLLFFTLCEIAARVGLQVHLERKYGPRLAEFSESDLVADKNTGWAWKGQQLFRARDDVSPGKPTDLFRIIAVGDSCVWGAMVPPESTFTAKLDRLLKREYGAARVEVLNSGVVGYGAKQVAAHVRDKLTPFKPDLIIYYGTGAEASLWMRGAGVSKAPLLERLHPYLFYSRAFLMLNHAVRALRPPTPPTAVLTQNDDITQLQQSCENHGAKLMLAEYLMVEKGIITSDLARVGDEFNVPVVRTLDTFTEQGRPPRELIFDHEHPTPLGHSLIATKLLDTIVAAKIIPTP